MSLSRFLMLAPILLAGCATIQRDNITARENKLSAAGFGVHPATTPAQVAMLTQAPANRLLQRTEGQRIVYIYADPVVCHCIYTGDQAAFGHYQQLVIQQRIADEQLEASEFNNDGWGWGPWGGFGPGFY